MLHAGLLMDQLQKERKDKRQALLVAMLLSSTWLAAAVSNQSSLIPLISLAYADAVDVLLLPGWNLPRRLSAVLYKRVGRFPNDAFLLSKDH
jgi:hypothetical protein